MRNRSVKKIFVSITEKLEEAFAENEEWLPLIGEALYQYQKKTVRKMILKDHKRPDGRAIEQIRPLAAEVDLIPRVHGSAMFTRGQTQICNITYTWLLFLKRRDWMVWMKQRHQDDICITITSRPILLGRQNHPEDRDAVRSDMEHLAERALVPVLPSEEEFPYAIRTVSETFESNGSTSQASICASTMSLMAAGVPIKKPVAGISCGLVTGDTDDDYIVLDRYSGTGRFLRRYGL